MLSRFISHFAQRSLFMVLPFVLGSAVAAAQSFKLPTNYPVGDNPNWGAAGDFNADGKQDLAIGNVHSKSVSILLNNGNGTFAPAVNYTVDFNPEAVATGDFNGDGKVDLAVGNVFGGPFSQGSVSILLGNGNGTFQAAVGYDAGSPFSISVADLNADGKQDLVIAGGETNKASVLIGNGNGTFQAAVTYPVGTDAREVAVADYNGDGKLDLAVSNIASSNISILLGLGNGSFQDFGFHPLGTRPVGIVTTDLNGDNKPDLLVAGVDADAVLVLLGIGNGGFQAAVPYSVGNEPQRLALADFNGDGKTDVVVVNANDNSYSVLRGNGNGTFQAAVTLQARTFSWSPIAADFDADGKPDLAIVDNGLDLVDVYLNSPKATGLNITATPAVPATVQVATFITYDNSKTAASFTANINWGDGTPPSAGSISVNGSGAFNISGTHTYSAAGNFNVTVQIADGSGNFASATGTAFVREVTSTALSSSANPSDLTQTVTFTATVTTGSGTPSGTVQFKDNGNNLGTPVTLNASGVATFSTSALTVGTHTITAEYSGNATLGSSAGTLAGGQVVRPQPSVSINDVSIVEGDNGTRPSNFTVTLSAASNLTVAVDFETLNFTSATAGVDYASAKGTLIFLPGETTKQLAITIFGDTSVEPDEQFIVGLSNAVNANITQATGSGFGMIINDDGPVILTDSTTRRAIALDSVTLTSDPFSLLNPNNLNNQDHRRRVSLFVWRLGLLPGDTVADVTVLTDSGSLLTVEYVGAFTPVPEVTQIVILLPDPFAGVSGNLLVKVRLHGRTSISAPINIAKP